MPAEDPKETRARVLLARAAETIDVAPAAPLTLTGLPEPRARRWPVLAAAAAVLVAAGGGWFVAQRTGDVEPGPADRSVVERPHPISGGEMPAVIGMTVAEARHVLEARGLRVDARRDNSTCAPDGTVVLTEPAVGRPVAPGRTVRLSVTDESARQGGPIMAACRASGAVVWDLVRFAQGLAGPPALAPEVELSLRGAATSTLSAADAADPSRWTVCDDEACHSALAAITEMLTRPSYGGVPSGFVYGSPYLTVQDLRWPGASMPWTCFDQDGADATRTWDYAVYLRPADAADCDGVTPPVLGIRLVRGAVAEVSILATRTAADDEADQEAGAHDAAAEATATAFVAWARGGGPAPRFADEVRVMLGGYEARDPMTDPADRDAWRLACPPTMSAPCPRSALDVLDAYDGPVVQSPTLASGCSAHPGALPKELRLAAEQDVVRLDQPEPRGCADAWSVELWIDDAGAIYAVDTAAPISG
ncbi:PASTA domain-containing protein [Nocardioides sp. MH1]|uniref:PASTA domain-containing protein n=1 Tax=Nocardioides sp. MH1 TaxID=3242490 RepID=UPI0035212B9C